MNPLSEDSDEAAMSRLDRVNKWLTLLANLGVVVGLVFVALEVRTNTATNRITIYQSSSQNWMQINSQLARDHEFVELLVKADSSDARLNAVEAKRFEGWVRQHLTHAAQMLRLHDAGLLDEVGLRVELRNIRELSDEPRFRRVVEQIVPTGRFRSMILDDAQLER